MKRMIRSSTKPVSAAYDLDIYSDLESKAYHCGYDLSVDADGNISVKGIDPEEKMPQIIITTITGSRTTYSAHMKFQDLDTEDEQYYDSMEYYLNQWMKAAQFVTYLLKWSPDDYIDDKE